ncbi:MAG TPA: hypothetical protein VK988_10620 [Acidimicrobiales bacterium]|nr:hypothetical protein [Acidimicrobiales bacterium]
MLTDLLALRRLILDEGMSVQEVAAAAGVSVAECEARTASLLERGELEVVMGSRLRLVPLLRSTRVGFVRAAELVRAGEWTTYGDIKKVATGTEAGSQAVGRFACSDPTFPNPHRVLMSGGLIARSWRDAAGNGPEYCRARLVEEGISFRDGGAADVANYVSAVALADRWDADPTSVRVPERPEVKGAARLRKARTENAEF